MDPNRIEQASKTKADIDANQLRKLLGHEGYEEFWDAIWDLDEQYGLPLTNNEPRIQDGRQLHEAAEFGWDVLEIVAKVINSLKYGEGVEA